MKIPELRYKLKNTPGRLLMLGVVLCYVHVNCQHLCLKYIYVFVVFMWQSLNYPRLDRCIGVGLTFSEMWRKYNILFSKNNNGFIASIRYAKPMP